MANAAENQSSTEPSFDPVVSARRVLRRAHAGALATLSGEGYPFASLVTVATTQAGEPVLLLSQLAVHTQNLSRDPRASLLLVEPGGETGDPLAGARLSIVGRIGGDDDPALSRRFLARHREAEGYAGFRDFAFYRMSVETSHLVAGFGRIVDIPREKLLVEPVPALLEAEPGAVSHMNEDHADAIRLYATRLLGLPDGEWRMTGLDPTGIDLSCEGVAARLDFPAPVDGPGDLRASLVELARRARSTDA